MPIDMQPILRKFASFEENARAVEMEEFFLERYKRVDDEAFLRILNREGGEEPRPEDRIGG